MFLQGFVQADESQRREIFLDIAKALCVYHNYPNVVKNENFFDFQHLDQLGKETRTKLYDELVKQLKEVGELPNADKPTETLLNQVPVLRALPEFFNILQEIRTDENTNKTDYHGNYLDIL